MNNRPLTRARKRDAVEITTGDGDESGDDEYAVEDDINPDEDYFVDESMQLSEVVIDETDNMDEDELSQTLRYIEPIEYH